MVWLHETGFTLVNPLVRPALFISMSRKVRENWGLLFRILPSFMDIIALGVFTVFFFAVVGTVLFEGTEEGKIYFPSVWMGMVNLHILLTTANYPDVMMPAYQEISWYFFYFMVFLVFTMYFILNLMLATVYDKYKREADKALQRKTEKAEEATTVAFHLLDVRQADQVEIPIFTMLLHELERPTFNLFNYDTSKVTLDYAKSLIERLSAAQAHAGFRGLDRVLFSKLVNSMVRDHTQRRRRRDVACADAVASGSQKLHGPLADCRCPCCSLSWGGVVGSKTFEYCFDVAI